MELTRIWYECTSIRTIEKPNITCSQYYYRWLLILMLFNWSICLSMCYRYTYIHIWIRRVILETDEELMDHIYSRPHLCPRLRLRRSGYCFRGLTLASQDTSVYYFRGLILHLTRNFIGDLYYAPYGTSRYNHHHKYDIIPASISFSHPSVNWVVYYMLSSDNVHSIFKVIQYP